MSRTTSSASTTGNLGSAGVEAGCGGWCCSHGGRPVAFLAVLLMREATVSTTPLWLSFWKNQSHLMSRWLTAATDDADTSDLPQLLPVLAPPIPAPPV
ncbi:hypothetical protein GUJ93_ZPchr0002g23923 [Zizania palustris]|uniref:Uncharacterized protein n=1 Tax=Zizania palustris TaxID=103762 RepID=A0A8J5RYJ9_ZIZPA|nr:hypothetical protein GUJ93_ZPchr0002g23923 [Zizania palustris]